MNFTGVTQYDDKYKHVGSFGATRSACSLFSVMVAKLFMDQTTYEDTNSYNNFLNLVIDNIDRLGINTFLLFDELVTLFTNLDKNMIEGTTYQILNELQPGTFFNIEEKDRYAIIFLKNSKFITVLVDRPENKFMVRDCHEICQYSFPTFDELMQHLDTVYQFLSPVVAGGLPIPEFSNMEYLVISEPFETNQLEYVMDAQVSEPDEGKGPESTNAGYDGDFEITGFEYGSDMDSEVGSSGSEPDTEKVCPAEGLETDQGYMDDLQLAMSLQQEEYGQ